MRPVDNGSHCPYSGPNDRPNTIRSVASVRPKVMHVLLHLDARRRLIERRLKPHITVLCMVGLVPLYILAWGLAGLQNANANDLDVFFLPSARLVLAGYPLDIYTLRYYRLYPNANGPLSLLPLTLAAAFLLRQGWFDDIRLRHMLIMAVFSVFSLLLAYEGVAAVDRLRSHRVIGMQRLAVYGIFACTPLLWLSMVVYGHIEQPLALWLVLRTVRKVADDQPYQAGVTFGLAVLARSEVCLYLIPLALMMLTRRPWRSTGGFVGTAFGTMTLGLLPFWIAHPSDLLFSLVTYRPALPIGGGSIWALTVGTSYEPIAQHADGFMVGLAVVATSLLVLYVRRDLGLNDRHVFGLLLLVGICFLLFVKTVWPYYFLDVYVFASVWGLGIIGSCGERWRWHSVQWQWPASIVVCTVVTSWRIWFPTSASIQRWESVLTFLLLSSYAVLVGAHLLRVDHGLQKAVAEAPDK